MPDFTADIQIWCGTCKDGLCGQSRAVVSRKGFQEGFEVDACDNCLEKARDEGYDKGYKAGLEAGRDESSA